MTKGDINIIKVLVKLLLGLSSGQLYFILVLLQLTVLTPFLIKQIETNKNAKCLFAITPIYLLGVYSYSLIYKQQIPFYQVPFPAWFVFYYFGLWVKIKGYKPVFKENAVVNSLILCVLGWIVSIVESYILLSLGISEGFASSQIKMSSFIYIFAVINLLMVIKPYSEGITISWLKSIGDRSYGIYYIHIFWVIISGKVLPVVPIIQGVLPLYQLLQLIFVMLFSYVSISFTRKILGEKASNQYLGF